MDLLSFGTPAREYADKERRTYFTFVAKWGASGRRWSRMRSLLLIY
jgi:hypothetical protein